MSKKISPDVRAAFRKMVYRYYERNRRDFLWRKTRNPYHIFVAEVMLQQTQASRVEAKFKEFIEVFPNFSGLARAPLREVLRVWQGMGYNRRALYLQQAAQEIMKNYEGELPRSIEELETLSGIGPASARSIAEYAFNQPVAFIETNIRAVYIHEFFKGAKSVSDKEIMPLVEQTLDKKNPWKWYNALMDYGVMLKEQHGNPGNRSAHYKKQSPFLSSDRRIRGAIIRCVTHAGPLTEQLVIAQCGFDAKRIRHCLSALVKDGLLAQKATVYSIP
jgi:A/G-specific adenine glycosylase